MDRGTPNGADAASTEGKATGREAAAAPAVRTPTPPRSASTPARGIPTPPDRDTARKDDGARPKGNVDKIGGKAIRPFNVDKSGASARPSQRRGGVTTTYRQPDLGVEPHAADGTLSKLVGKAPKRDKGKLRSFWEAAGMRAEMESIKAAHDVLQSAPAKILSEGTLAEYRRALKRLDGRLPIEMAPTSSRRTAYVYRAAFIHDLLTRRLPEAVTAGKMAVADMDVDALRDAAAETQTVLALLDEYPPCPDGGGERAAPDESFYEVVRKPLPKAALRPTKGPNRKLRLNRFPKGDWRVPMWEAAMASRLSPSSLAALAVLSLVGLRPKELESGIRVEADEKSVLITLERPAKSHSGRYGLGPRTHRRFFVGSDKLAVVARWLNGFAEEAGGEAVVRIGHRHLRRIVRDLSRRAFPDIPHATPYDYRHQYSAEVKRAILEKLGSEGFDERKAIFVAEHMGHGSTVSQRSYGTAGQSGKGAIRKDRKKEAILYEVDEVKLHDPRRRVRVKRSRVEEPEADASPDVQHTPAIPDPVDLG